MRLALFCGIALLAPTYALLGETSCISFSNDNAFTLATTTGAYALPILLSSSAPECVHVAAASFADDIRRVTGVRPKFFNDTLPEWATNAIIVGTVEDDVINNAANVSSLSGQWEAYSSMVVDKPLNGVDRALVIAGSDKRGAIYGMYSLSEQMGVTPWYWWADVAVVPRDTVAFEHSCVSAHGEPTVKYRGWFINDEAPVMTNWIKYYWNISDSTPEFGPWMYEHMFELMLRLKANYFWPAMWTSMFDVDGLNVTNGLPKIPTAGPNQVLANRMGIVMGTSHQEPMARNTNEWNEYGVGAWNFSINSQNLTEFWTYGAERAIGKDTLFSMGMRGNGDLPLPGANVPIMENITAVQQQILRTVYNVTSTASIPQLWCMYKEVFDYYQGGVSDVMWLSDSKLQVPDDVTIMFSDDNWGNIQGVLPWGSNHTAGGGIYYHVDCTSRNELGLAIDVGSVRDYKWINTISLAKMWEQMDTAVAYNTDKIWILNVGDMKHLERPLEWFLSLAYDHSRWPRNSLTEWLTLWAQRDFGADAEMAAEIADIQNRYQMMVSRAKPELLNSSVWSLYNYNEADTIIANWTKLESRSKCIYDSLDDRYKDAYLELQYTPVQLLSNLNQLYVSAARSTLYAQQFIAKASFYAEDAEYRFFSDRNISMQYEKVQNNKWMHQFDQVHINYQHWYDPSRNIMPPVATVNMLDPADSNVKFQVENLPGSYPGSTTLNCAGGTGCPDPTLFTMDPYGASSRWVKVSASGPVDSYFYATPNVSWLVATPSEGAIKSDGSTDTVVTITVDWTKVPTDRTDWAHGGVVFNTTDGTARMVATVPVNNAGAPPSDFHGFVQGDGYVVMEAAHYTSNTSAVGSDGEEYAFEEIQWYGRTLSGFKMYPLTAQNFSLGEGPSLSYDFWSTGLSTNATWTITVDTGPNNNYFVGQNQVLGFQLDNMTIALQAVPTIPSNAALGALAPDWTPVVSNEVRHLVYKVNMTDFQSPGPHTLKLWGMSSGVVAERITVDFGGIGARGWSYLGPSESKRV